MLNTISSVIGFILLRMFASLKKPITGIIIIMQTIHITIDPEDPGSQRQELPCNLDTEIKNQIIEKFVSLMDPPEESSRSELFHKLRTIILS